MWILLKTACGCTQWQEWHRLSPRIVVPMLEVTKGFPKSADEPLPPFLAPPPGNKLRRREFEFEGEYPLGSESEMYRVYTEVLGEVRS